MLSSGTCGLDNPPNQGADLSSGSERLNRIRQKYLYRFACKLTSYSRDSLFCDFYLGCFLKP